MMGFRSWNVEYAEYDGIILDIMMPRMDGIQVLKKMRSQNCKETGAPSSLPGTV